MSSILRNSIFFVIAVVIGYGIYNYYYIPNFTIGNKAPNIEGINHLEQSIELDDLEGYFILLDFWGSWCPPCRQENPQLVALYDKYQNKAFKDASGFTIFSVGIETKKARWIKAIKDDNLKWPYHVSDFNRFKTKSAQAYGVRSIPTKYLIAPNGEILGVNLSLEAIEKRLERHLK